MTNPFAEVDNILTGYTLDNFISPISGEVTSIFGDSRSGGRRKHTAIDYAAPAGSPYVAPADLEYIQGGVGGTNLRPNDKWAHFRVAGTPYEFRVAHIGELPEAGAKFKQGDPIGTVGGVIKGTHLHAGFYNTETEQYEDLGSRYGLKKGTKLTAGIPLSDLERRAAATAATVNPFAEVDSLIEGKSNVRDFTTPVDQRRQEADPFAEVDALIQGQGATPQPAQRFSILDQLNRPYNGDLEKAAMAGVPEAGAIYTGKPKSVMMSDEVYNDLSAKYPIFKEATMKAGPEPKDKSKPFTPPRHEEMWATQPSVGQSLIDNLFGTTASAEVPSTEAKEEPGKPRSYRYPTISAEPPVTGMDLVKKNVVGFNRAFLNPLVDFAGWMEDVLAIPSELAGYKRPKKGTPAGESAEVRPLTATMKAFREKVAPEELTPTEQEWLRTLPGSLGGGLAAFSLTGRAIPTGETLFGKYLHNLGTFLPITVAQGYGAGGAEGAKQGMYKAAMDAAFFTTAGKLPTRGQQIAGTGLAFEAGAIISGERDPKKLTVEFLTGAGLQFLGTRGEAKREKIQKIVDDWKKENNITPEEWEGIKEELKSRESGNVATPEDIISETPPEKPVEAAGEVKVTEPIAEPTPLTKRQIGAQNAKIGRQLKTIDDLLVNEAIGKAQSANDEWNLDRYQNMAKAKKLTPAERSDLNIYIFGDAEGRTIDLAESKKQGRMVLAEEPEPAPAPKKEGDGPRSVGNNVDEVWKGWKELESTGKAGGMNLVGRIVDEGGPDYSIRQGKLTREFKPGKKNSAYTEPATDADYNKIDDAINRGAFQIEARPPGGVSETQWSKDIPTYVFHQATGKFTKAGLESRLKSGRITPEQATDWGYFEQYPDLAPKGKGGGEVDVKDQAIKADAHLSSESEPRNYLNTLSNDVLKELQNLIPPKDEHGKLIADILKERSGESTLHTVAVSYFNTLKKGQEPNWEDFVKKYIKELPGTDSKEANLIYNRYAIRRRLGRPLPGQPTPKPPLLDEAGEVKPVTGTKPVEGKPTAISNDTQSTVYQDPDGWWKIQGSEERFSDEVEANRVAKVLGQYNLGEEGFIDLDFIGKGVRNVKNMTDKLLSRLLPGGISKDHREAAQVVGQRIGHKDRQMEIADNQLRPFRKMLDRLGVNNPDIPIDQNIGFKLASDLSVGRTVDPQFQAYANARDRLYNILLRALDKAGAPLENVRENYFPGMWKKDSIRAFNQAIAEYKDAGNVIPNDDIFLLGTREREAIRNRVAELVKSGEGSDTSALPYLTKRPLKGKESFRKAKTFDDFFDGVEFGLQPISNNPVKLDLLKMNEMAQSALGHGAIKEYKGKGDIKKISPYQEPPPGWEKINDRFGTIYGPPSPSGEFGRRIMGHYIAKKPVADVLNNYLSQSLYNSPIAPLYKPLMAVGNLLNQFQLGLGSVFHGGFVTIEAQVSANAELLKDIYGFAVKRNRSLEDVQKSLGKSVMAIGRTPYVGNKLLEIWRNPDNLDVSTDRPVGQLPTGVNERLGLVAKAVELAGGGFDMDPGLRTNQAEKLYADWFGGQKIKAAFRSPIALSEISMAPVLKMYVPRVKAGVFAEMVGRIVEMNPDKTLEQLRPELREAWNRVDARLGQVRYNRLFMHNYAKNAMQALIRAPGWTGGTLAEVGGSPKDAAKFFVDWLSTGKMPTDMPDRVAYTMALMGTIMGANALLNKAFTGEWPQDPMDWWAFRTGKKDKYGNAERWLLPSYVKDIYAYWNNPEHTIMAKTHPVFSVLNEMWTGQDYYKQMFRDPQDKFPQRAWDTIKHTAMAWEPFWTRGARKAGEQQGGVLQTLEASPGRVVAPLFGVMPASKAYTQTASDQILDDYYKLKGTIKPKSEAEKFEKRREVEALGFAAKESPEKLGEFKAKLREMQKGDLTPRQAKNIEKKIKDIKKYRFEGVKEIGIMVKAYQQGAEDEKRIYGPVLEKKINNIVYGRNVPTSQDWAKYKQLEPIRKQIIKDKQERSRGRKDFSILGGSQ